MVFVVAITRPVSIARVFPTAARQWISVVSAAGRTNPAVTARESLMVAAPSTLAASVVEMVRRARFPAHRGSICAVCVAVIIAPATIAQAFRMVTVP